MEDAKVQVLFAEALIVDAASLRFPAWDITAAAAALTTNRNTGRMIKSRT